MASGVCDKTCEFCKKEISKYTCPKCAAYYCGLACYRSEKHLSCSESFYKNQVMSELQSKKASKKEKAKMLEILKRASSENKGKDSGSLGDLESETLADRMKGLNLSEASFEDIWGKLSKKERILFEEVVKEGDIELDKLCIPWWLNKSVMNRNRKILEMEDIDKSPDDEIQEIPKVIKNLQSMKELLPNKESSHLLVFNIAEVINTYAFVNRLYNGEMDDSIVEALDTIMSISKVLNSNCTYTDIQSSLSSFVLHVKECKEYSDTIDPVVTLDDFCCIINSALKVKGFSYDVPASLVCMSHLHELFTAGVEHIKNQKVKTSIHREKKQKFLQVARKVYFMACWLVENSNRLSKLKGIAQSLRVELENYWSEIEQSRQIVEENIDAIKAEVLFVQLLHDSNEEVKCK
eukprot:gene207-822_t